MDFISNIETQYNEADRMCDFWGEQAMKGLNRAIEGIEDLQYSLLIKYNEDAETIQKIDYALSDFLALARDRYRFWFRKSIELEKKCESTMKC